MRLLFVADEHSSMAVLRKSLRAVEEYQADVMVLSGDLCGKQLIPIVKKRSGMYFAGHRGRDQEFDRSGVEQVENDLEATGYYLFHCDERGLERLRADDAAISRLFLEKILDRLEVWKRTIAQSVDLNRVMVFVTPGNDDPLEIDEPLSSFQAVGIMCNLRGAQQIGKNRMITLDYTPPTPWHTPREVEEGILSRMIQEKAATIRDPHLAIFNFHCPPARTQIDLAPELDSDLRPVVRLGGEGRVHVGSEAVRKAIEDYQPTLGLHGHVHEAPGEEHVGRTVCLNPGSEYWNGVLHAYVIDLNDSGQLVRQHRIEG